MSPARLSLVALAVPFIALTATPSDTCAQFGKIKKALGKKAEATETSGCVPAGKGTEVTTFSMTAAQMAKVNAGLDAELAAAPGATAEYDKQQAAMEKEQAAYEKASAEHDKQNTTYMACVDKVTASDMAQSEKLRAESDAEGAAVRGEMSEEEITALAERAQAAMERISAGQGTAEDQKTVAEFQAMAMGFQSRGETATAASQKVNEFDAGHAARLEKACGKEPVAPTAPGSPMPPYEAIRSAGAKAAGMSAGDYHLARETLLAAAMGNLVVKPGAGNPSGAGGGAGGNQGTPATPSDAEAMNQEIKTAAGKVCALREANIPL